MAVIKQKKKFRQVDGRAVEDVANISNITYNEASGGFKSINVGPFLIPLNISGGGFTTDATTARAIRKGASIAIYNNSATVQSATFGDSSAMAALAAGVADVNGNVGVACKPADWTYLNSNEKSWIRTTSVNLLVYLILDESYISSQG